jgi:diguanylate cyclase
MEPLTAAATMTAIAIAGIAAAGWYYGRRIRRVEAYAARLRRQLRAEYHAANHDPLTGLPNRRGLFRLGEALIAEAGRAPLAAIVVDLDDFKQANDRFGHATGDRVLVTIANRFAAWAARNGRPGCVISRLGGDEFAGLLAAPNPDPGWLQQSAWRLTETLSAPIQVNGRTVSINASVGITAVPAGMPLAEALRRADQAMYRAKGGLLLGT